MRSLSRLAFRIREQRTSTLRDRRAIVFGRGRESDFVVADPSLSIRHARMRRVGGHVVVDDLESHSGIVVQGRRVDRAELRPGEALVAGDVEVRVLTAPVVDESTFTRSPVGGDVVVASPVMRTLHEQLDRVAEAPVCVLLSGETGVGKEVIARSIHERSALARPPFLAINCGAIPRDLVESSARTLKSRSFGCWIAVASSPSVLTTSGPFTAASSRRRTETWSSWSHAVSSVKICCGGFEGASVATLKARIAAFEANCIRSALEATNGNQTEAAKRLGIAVRTLVDKIKKHGLKKRYD